MAAYQDFLHWLQANMLACPSKKYLHLECPGCGLQRSVLLLLKGDLPASFRMYPAAIPLMALAVFLALHIKYQFRNGATVIKYLQAGIAIIIVVFYIYKIVNHKIAD
ncbi:MAG: DUF2752 domain-containing protein [Bacteroidetes bacterium]|nr:DUF2752 domain-containing protein [Bacteroidota bacterium]